MSTIETDVNGENPSARIKGKWVDAPMREELQAFLDGVNGLANNAASAAQQATTAASEAGADKAIVLGKAAEVATSLEETKTIANNVAVAGIAIEQAKQTASQAAASAGTSAMSADNSATAATVQANKAKVEADKAIAAAAQQQDLMNQHVIAANPHSQYLQDAPRDGEQYVREDGGWAKVVIPEQGVQEAPVDGKQYVRKSAAWAEVVIPESGVPEAPKDGLIYTRKDGEWVKLSPNDLLKTIPRILSFYSINGTGYVSGTVIAQFIADLNLNFSGNFKNSQASYILQDLVSSLPGIATIGVYHKPVNLAAVRIGTIQFTPGAIAPSFIQFDGVTTIPAGDTVVFTCESLTGISSVSINLWHTLG